MRILLLLLLAGVTACAPAEKEVVTTSVNVDEENVAALFAAVDALTDDALDVATLRVLAEDTPMDDERQERIAVIFDGTNEEIQVHVWREQVDWVHVYFSSTSQSLIDAIATVSSRFARDDAD